ncbi:Hint domain-containing protein, partial [Methylobacterium sp. J-030]|uniref:Hint domain-containing protein n=1 Tax=Methylobacterium sp. J-030 TaxID=2836627 RepID=UPI001FBBBE42
MNPITFNYTGAIQNYTVPVTGTYDLSGFGAAGAAGSNSGNISTGGSGAQVGATFNLTQGQQLQIIVGGAGSQGIEGGGGGGFTAVLANSGVGTAYSYLLIAGGGGGGGVNFGNSPIANGLNAQASPQGALLGTGGAAGNSQTGGGGGGGAGATSNGGSSSDFDGGLGGSTGPSYAGGHNNSFPIGNGGFGGGGGGGAIFGGGGGGGGNFGGVGGTAYGSGGGYIGGGGGGGGTSYLAASGTLNSAETRAGAGVSTGNGSARINLVSAAPAQPAAPCYVTGTRIRILRGRTIVDVPVERLRVGDLAITASGQPRPIRWIGSRSYPGLSAPQADRPVRIKAGALADGVPARDLLVSPDHCLWLDGLLVAAGHLVNGTSITRGEAVRDLTYWHVELDSHDILLAEATPAESFLAAPGVRSGFDGVGELVESTTPVPYAPRVERHDPRLDALRERLIRRAGLSTEPMHFGTVRAWMDRCDGTHIAGWAQDAAHPDAPVCLDIVVDGVVVAMTLAEQYRADIAAAGVGDGRHGFEFNLDE